MKQRTALFILVAPLALLLGACSERPQTGHNVQPGQAAYAGTGSTFTAPGWTAGDRGSWEQQLKARTQRGQNEYNKITQR